MRENILLLKKERNDSWHQQDTTHDTLYNTLYNTVSKLDAERWAMCQLK